MKRYAIGVAVLAVTGTVCAQAVQWTQAEGGGMGTGMPWCPWDQALR